jgi:hypothetical protein
LVQAAAIPAKVALGFSRSLQPNSETGLQIILLQILPHLLEIISYQSHHPTRVLPM